MSLFYGSSTGASTGGLFGFSPSTGGLFGASSATATPVSTGWFGAAPTAQTAGQSSFLFGKPTGEAPSSLVRQFPNTAPTAAATGCTVGGFGWDSKLGGSGTAFGTATPGIFGTVGPSGAAAASTAGTGSTAISSSLLGGGTAGQPPSSLFPSGLGGPHPSSALALRPTSTACISPETQRYLETVERRLTVVESGEVTSDYLYFTLSAVDPGFSKALGGAAIPSAAVPAGAANAWMEQELMRCSDQKLLSRFLEAKSSNPDLNSIYCIPIKGFSGLTERSETLKSEIQSLCFQTEGLSNICKQQKARITMTMQQVKRIQSYNKALRCQLVRLTKMMEDLAQLNGQYELRPDVSRENEVVLQKFKDFFAEGAWDDTLANISRWIKVEKAARGDTQVTQYCVPFDDAASQDLSDLVDHHKWAIHGLLDSLSKMEPGLSTAEALLN